MRGQAVQDYVKKKRGLYAADGGEVPDDDGYYDSEAKQWVSQQPPESMDDRRNDTIGGPAPTKDQIMDTGNDRRGVRDRNDIEQLASSSASSRPGNPVDDIENGADDEIGADSEPDEPAAATPPDRQQQMKDYLSAKYGEAADDSGIKNAIAESKHQNLVANLGDAFHDIATARATANGAAPDSGKFFQGMRDQGQRGVAQADAERQQKIQAFVQQNAMNRQASQDKQRIDANAALGTFRKDKMAQGQKQFEDAQKSLGERSKASLEDKKRHDDLGEKELGIKLADASSRRESAALEKQKYADERGDKKAEKDQANSFLEMENKGMGGRGAPQYISQNMRTQQSIKNAQKMLDKVPIDPATGKPDYDHLNDKQIHLFNTELERIASNGSPTESGRHAMEADTIASHWAEFKQKFSGKPTPANVGEFVRQNAEYLHDLKDSVDSTVNGFRRENHDNYLSAGKISAKQSQDYKDRHPELFPKEQDDEPPAAAPAPAVGGPGMAVGAPAGAKQPDGKVKIQAPNGEVRLVSPDSVEKYTKMGGKVVP